jgi:hypothetical protein
VTAQHQRLDRQQERLDAQQQSVHQADAVDDVQCDRPPGASVLGNDLLVLPPLFAVSTRETN